MNRKVILISVIAAVLIAASILTIIIFKNKSGELESGFEDFGLNIEDLDEAKLTFYFEAQEPKDTREILDQIEKKSKSKLNVKLDFKFIWDYPEGFLNQVKGLVASGQPCDAFCYSGNFPQDLGTLAKDNVIKDITMMFPQCAPDYYEKFSKEELATASVDGHIYAVPNRLPTSQMRCAIVREDLMAKYNIPDIKNYDDYEVYLKAIKENEKDMVPMTFYETAIGLFAEANGYVILDYEQGLVYKWDDPGMKIMAWEQTPEFRRSLERLNGWYANGYLLKGASITQIDDHIISSGKWASVISVLGNEFEYNSILKSKNVNWRYKAYALYPDRFAARNSPMDGTMVISANSNNAERALMFINWLQLNQANYDSLMYGIEGKHYTLVNDRIKLPDGISLGESCFSWGWRWPLRNIDFERTDLSSSGGSVKEYYKTIKGKTKYPPHMGFKPDYSTVTDITTYRRISFFTTEQKIYAGAFKQEDVDTYIQDQKSNGADNLVKEVQEQLDKWKAGNSADSSNPGN